MGRPRYSVTTPAGQEAIAGVSNNVRGTVEVLLRNGADVNEEDDDTETNALHQAIDKRQFSLVPFLIEKGANRNDKDVRGFTPLAKAVVAGDAQTVRLLLAKKVPPNTMSDGGSTPLSTACKFGQLEIATALIEAGAAIDAEAFYQALLRAGHRPVIVATGLPEDHSPAEPACYELLTHKGGNAVSQSRDGSIVLHVAACENNVAVAELCIQQHTARGDSIKNGIDLQSNESAMTPLMLCCRHGSVGVAKKLLDAKADMNARDKDGNTPLHHTWWETKGRVIHNSRMYEFLVQKGADKDATNNDGYKPELPDDGSCPMM